MEETNKTKERDWKKELIEEINVILPVADALNNYITDTQLIKLVQVLVGAVVDLDKRVISLEKQKVR